MHRPSPALPQPLLQAQQLLQLLTLLPRRVGHSCCSSPVWKEAARQACNRRVRLRRGFHHHHITHIIISSYSPYHPVSAQQPCSRRPRKSSKAGPPVTYITSACLCQPCPGTGNGRCGALPVPCCCDRVLLSLDNAVRASAVCSAYTCPFTSACMQCCVLIHTVRPVAFTGTASS
ncbi:hypothetical protein COO60DRAFT_1594358 [Scenedesmus sp. NREL 46B-D3]|nr:hypothetical protein COO60DRAFT_1594358 [Scenedesmus sp. NREL 46B-D3]